MILEVTAPAKLNLVLEVTGRRADGYHEIASLMQTVDLADAVRLSLADSIELEITGEELLGVPREGPRNLAYRAAHALTEAAAETSLGARIEVEKRIPAGMGLGGGSSDAAAVLRGLNQLWQLDFSLEQLEAIGASVGSDVPFFLHGGACLVGGRGERVEPLADAITLEATVFVADVEIDDKTRRMYAALTPADYSDGRRAHVAAECVRRGLPITEAEMANAFDRHIGEVAPPLAGARALCKDAGLAVFACGSGPAFFTLLPRAEVPALLLRELERDWGVRAIACRSLGRAEATAVRQV
ncbi:MAG TPA: 4-(cytidine 5'-diphospho)-2-C-methyl-D-erythritol kinase [Dehalococcoidia bacterium]|nr:4-(cytidine 5'-diphospho)-2-C-methyl-D-erythritol kinase [Dehalococcoidia bacterium]